jgi:hypothetical protein
VGRLPGDRITGRGGQDHLPAHARPPRIIVRDHDLPPPVWQAKNGEMGWPRHHGFQETPRAPGSGALGPPVLLAFSPASELIIASVRLFSCRVLPGSSIIYVSRARERPIKASPAEPGRTLIKWALPESGRAGPTHDAAARRAHRIVKKCLVLLTFLTENVLQFLPDALL